MPNVINYATTFERDLKQKYTREALSSGLTTEEYSLTTLTLLKYLM